MSSTYKSSPTADAQAHNSHELADDLGLSINNHLTNTPFEQSHLSPYYSHTVSNQTSPYNIGSTPDESTSEHSNYQPSEFSEIEDPFFGVDFSAGVFRIDSLPSALLGNAEFDSVEINQHQQEPQGAEPRSAADTLTTSTYPLSPRYTSIANTPSPRSEANDLKTKTTISQHELINDLHNTRLPDYTSLAPTHFAAVQLTPDHSGSSHTSSEGVEPGNMAPPEHNPHYTVSQWGNEPEQAQPNTSVEPGEQYSSTGHTESYGTPSSTQQRAQPFGLRDDEEPVRGGFDPESRTAAEGLSLKEQEEERRLEVKNSDVFQWISQGEESSGSEDEQSEESYFDVTKAAPRIPKDPLEAQNDISQMNETYVHQNRLQDGQVYYSLKDNGSPKAKADEELLKGRPRQWNDPPSLPFVTLTHDQPVTSNDAIKRYNINADTISIKSRVATWGTTRTIRRRQSEPSLFDYEGVEEIGSFLKKLSMKPKEGERRQSNFFDQGLEGLGRFASIVRRKSDAKLKRTRSTQNIPEEAQNVPQPRHNSQGSLAPPPRRNPSFSRRQTPSINTAIGAMTGSLTAVGGSAHARKGSLGGAPTSPKSPPHLSFARSVITRVRSKSELTSQDRVAQSGLVGLLRAQGGPPVANLAASPPLETDVRPFQSRPRAKRQPPPKAQDDEDDEEDEEEQGDDADVNIESTQQVEPIVPNYEGFKAHVRRLNPEMDSRCNWLVSRIAHQQEIRYKHLLEMRVKHSQAVGSRTCGAGHHCLVLGGHATLLDAKGNPRDSGSAPGLQIVTDFSDDSSPGEGALTNETFPPGVPMPPTKNLPAEFECQLCFKAKKFQKPSDWTKHVHEDVQPFTCTFDKCKESKSFKRKADWVRHENERHRHLEWWVCQIDDCKHPCYRKDNFLQHLVREHKLPEPKQKTKAAIKKARDTEPAWIMLEQCHHETSNRPQDESCKFCGKSFNSWKKLTVHLAMHMQNISLPVLHFVESKVVDANTIISPIREQILTPITPTDQAKLESSHSPFPMDSVSPYIPMAQHFSPAFGQSAFDQTTGPSTAAYGLQAPVAQDVTYDQSPNMFSNNFGVQHMVSPQGFGSMNHNGFSNMNQNRPFGSLDSGFTQPKIEQPRHFASVDSGFSHGLPDQSYDLHQTSGFTMPQNYASAPPVVPGYQAPDMLGISHAGYDFNPMAVNGPQQPQQQQSYQQVPMNRAQGSASPYGHSPQNIQNYYGQQ